LGIIIRSCQENDLPALAGLLAELVEVAGSSGPLDIPGIRGTWERMQAAPDHYLTLVAEADGQVVGAASLLFYRSYLHRTGTAQINELVVTSARRGENIGQKLVLACKAEALGRGMDELEVGTELDNLPARSFYRKLGFDEEYALLGMEFEPPAQP